MKIINRISSIAAAFALLGGLTFAAPKTNHESKYLTISGKVIKKDTAERTLLVEDKRANKLYLVNVPDGSVFKITFGLYMRMAEPGFENVRTGERVQIRCTRDNEHLSRIEGGREVVSLTAQ